jgi:pre-mRNA-splicing helicase BRR2
MSNEKCHLPPGSIKVTKKGYEEIQVPAVKHKSFKDKLIKIEEMPKWA